MSKILLPAIMAAALAASSTAAYAQTSVACTYMLLRVYKAELDYCKVALPKPREDRYTRMRAGMEQFIRANGKNDPEMLIAGVETNIKRAIAGLPSCRSEDFRLAQQAMDKMTTEDNENLIRETLKIPRDPQLGSCG